MKVTNYQMNWLLFTLVVIIAYASCCIAKHFVKYSRSIFVTILWWNVSKQSLAEHTKAANERRTNDIEKKIAQSDWAKNMMKISHSIVYNKPMFTSCWNSLRDSIFKWKMSTTALIIQKPLNFKSNNSLLFYLRYAENNRINLTFLQCNRSIVRVH